jgi:hypothetical protein
MATSVVIRFSVDRAILIGWYGLGIFGARRGLPRREEEHGVRIPGAKVARESREYRE